jgi:hypothetical protein
LSAIAVRVVGRPVGVAAVLLVNVLACLVCLGFLWVYRATLKQLFLFTADRFDSVSVGALGRSVRPFGPIAALFRWLAAEIDHRLAQLVGLTEGAVVFLWDNLTGQITDAIRSFYELGEAVADALDRITTTTIPNVILTAERRVSGRIADLRAQLTRIEHVGSLALHRAVAVIDGQLGTLRDAAGALKARLAKVERLTVGVGAAALVGLALGRIGLGWTRCRNVGKVGRAACRMDTSLLEALVADSLLFFGTFALVDFAREMQSLTDEAAAAIRALTRQD